MALGNNDKHDCHHNIKFSFAWPNVRLFSCMILLSQLHAVFLNYAAVIGDCHIQYQSSSAVTTPEYGGIPPRSYYSCVANSNCDYEVHVLGSYESTQRGFQQHPTGYPDVYLTVTGISSRPLILVLSSYEPAAWTLHIPTGVEIDKVIIVSLHCCNLIRQLAIGWCLSSEVVECMSN